MRVALDINALYTTQAGSARYVRGLLKGLQQVRPPDVDFFELAWPVENFGYRQPQRALRTVYRELVWSRWAGPRILHARQTDLLHSCGAFLLSPRLRVRHVLTLYDLALLRHPERFRPWQRWAGARRLRRVQEADRVICISRFTAEEAMGLLGIPSRKLEVIYCGSDFHADQPAVVEQAPPGSVPDCFFVYVGSLEPGKNLALLREAYRLADARGIALPPLLIVGARWEGVASEGAPPKDWVYLGRQPDAVLVYLLKRARALLFPSKYEGFGLPVLEAMTLGCPVVCSRVASLPEVGGEAVDYRELTPEAYLQGMQQMLTQDEWRRELSQRGRAQARPFTWQRCAEQTADLYREVCEAD